jgi:hypothetical protein
MAALYFPVFIRDLGGFVVYRFRQSQQKVHTSVGTSPIQRRCNSIKVVVEEVRIYVESHGCGGVP